MLKRATLLAVVGLAAALAACSDDHGEDGRGDAAVVEFAPEPANQPVAPEPETAPAPDAEQADTAGLPEGPIPYDQLKEGETASAPAPKKSDENVFY